MGFPIRRAAERTFLIALMLSGGLLLAGISSAHSEDDESADATLASLPIAAAEPVAQEALAAARHQTVQLFRSGADRKGVAGEH